MVYLIQGLFFQNYQSLGIAFGPDGSRTVLRTGLHRFGFRGVIYFESINNPTRLVGEMNDYFGHSRLYEVVLTDKELSFDKWYEDDSSVIRYNFHRECSIWVGSYQGGSVDPGGAKCITTEVPENFFQPPTKEFQSYIIENSIS